MYLEVELIMISTMNWPYVWRCDIVYARCMSIFESQMTWKPVGVLLGNLSGYYVIMYDVSKSSINANILRFDQRYATPQIHMRCTLLQSRKLHDACDPGVGDQSTRLIGET